MHAASLWMRSRCNPQDGEAVKMVVRMDALFLVDREARQQGMTAAERLAFRREHARAVGGGDSAGVPGDIAPGAAAERVGQGRRPTR